MNDKYVSGKILSVLTELTISIPITILWDLSYSHFQTEKKEAESNYVRRVKWKGLNRYFAWERDEKLFCLILQSVLDYWCSGADWCRHWVEDAPRLCLIPGLHRCSCLTVAPHTIVSSLKYFAFCKIGLPFFKSRRQKYNPIL